MRDFRAGRFKRLKNERLLSSCYQPDGKRQSQVAYDF
jgi:hypothetical protein